MGKSEVLYVVCSHIRMGGEIISIAPYPQFLKVQPKSDAKEVSQCHCTMND